jgi:8-oxo-dGTP pyrophosphatase MutT (NUDIX family)
VGTVELRYIVNVEGAIVRDGRFLMAVRSEREAHAPGTLALVGGKVEAVGAASDVLEETLRREIAEEVGVIVAPELTYLYSTAFVTDYGAPVVDVAFLCRHAAGEPAALDPDEIAGVVWLTAAEIAANPQVPPWTRHMIALAEVARLRLGW